MRKFKKRLLVFVFFSFTLLALFMQFLLIVVLGFFYCCYWVIFVFALISAKLINRRNLFPINRFVPLLFNGMLMFPFKKIKLKLINDCCELFVSKILLFGFLSLRMCVCCTSTLICLRPASRTTWASPVLRSCQHRRRRSSVSPSARRTARTRRSPSLRSFAVPPPGGA